MKRRAGGELRQGITNTAGALKTHGRIDILVNNAGITGGHAPTWDLSPEVWRRVIEAKLIGPYLTCRAIVPLMRAQGYGRIVNVASVPGKEGNPNAKHHGTAKAGLSAVTKSLATEDCAFSTGTVFDVCGGRATY